MIESAGVVCRGRLPSRMHHHADVTRDMAATRTFYEDLIGLPLVATWCESDVLRPRDGRAYTGGDRRPAEAGRYGEPAIYSLDHGYGRSVYVVHPNGLILEFARDHPNAATINQPRLSTAHRGLTRWLAGDHRSNNVYHRADRLTVRIP